MEAYNFLIKHLNASIYKYIRVYFSSVDITIIIHTNGDKGSVINSEAVRKTFEKIGKKFVAGYIKKSVNINYSDNVLEVIYPIKVSEYSDHDILFPMDVC